MSDSKNADLGRAQILRETAQIAWTDLQRWFASGNAIYVSQELNLVETAYQLSTDNTVKFREWMKAGQIDKVGDELAQEWLNADALMWAVVVKPWVLVQPVPGNAAKLN